MLDHRSPTLLGPRLTRRWRLSTCLAILAATALIAACSSSPTAAPSSTSPRLVGVPPTHPHSSTPTTTPEPWPYAGPCPRSSIPQLPPGSGCATRAIGDFDGDGASDRFIVYAHPLAADGTAEAWHVMLLLAKGGVVERGLPTRHATGNVGVVTAVDANRDGRSEALVLLNMGASDDFTRLFSLHGSNLVQVRGPDGRPFVLDTGGSVRQGSGAGCLLMSHQPVLFTSEYHAKADRYHWSRTFYRWDGLRVFPVRTQGGTTSTRGTSRDGQFTCYRLHLGASTRPKVVY